MVRTKLSIIKGCHSCPYVKASWIPGARYSLDYFCSLTSTKVASCVEWTAEKRPDGDFPADCPLTDGTPTE